MSKVIIFSVLTLIVTIISWRTLFNVKTHGFYRYFSWVCILWMISSNYQTWFSKPQSIYQVIGILLMITSGVFIFFGFYHMTKMGKIKKDKNRTTLFTFEQTTELVDKGAYKYIRHPFYASLLFLTWGLFFKNITLDLSLAAILSTFFIYLTAIFDEKECIEFFGEAYSEYMRRTKRFVPFLL